jgi:hypothetical protein
MPCQRCQKPTIEIEMALEGRRMVMRSCRQCDTRSWEYDGEAVGLDHVLSSIPPTRYKREPARG